MTRPPGVALRSRLAAEPRTLSAAYERCRQLHARHGRTYYLATLLLPRWKRRHVHALYGFVRYADEIVDDLASTLDRAGQAAALRAWGDRFFAGLRGAPVQDPVLPAVLHTVRAFDLDLADFEQFLDSMAMDLTVDGYRTYQDLLGYMEGSAAVIGTMMAPILEPVDLTVAREHARQLGLAFQLTNFIRDIGEDLDRGRVYLPAEDLERFGVSRAHLAAVQASPAVQGLLAFEVERARAHYAAAAPGIGLLAPSSRPCIQVATALYGGILDEVERAGYQVLARRVAVPRHRRLQVAGRHLLPARAAARAERRVSVTSPAAPERAKSKGGAPAHTDAATSRAGGNRPARSGALSSSAAAPRARRWHGRWSMSPTLLGLRGRAAGPLAVAEGVLDGGLPYLGVGKGPPLVVLSGFTAEHANPTGAARRFSLRPLVPLARQFSVYLVNRKPGLAPGSSMEDLAGHYAHALERAFTGPVAVAGISTGGSIAQQLAIDHPHLVGRLVLVAAACRLAPTGRRMQRDLARYTVAGQPRRAWAATGPELAATTAGGYLYTVLLWLFGPRLNPEDPSDMLIVSDAEDGFDAAPRLHRITAPTLVVAGDHDRNYTPELFRETAERIPGAWLRLYPGKSHASIATLRYKPAVCEILRFLAADEVEPSTRSLRPRR